jgi:hypothetical protein
VVGAEVDDWYALLTARTGDLRRSREISARLAALDEPGLLFGVASRMISENAGFHWYIEPICDYIEPICDRLPPASLRQLAGKAARARGVGGNEAADAVIAYISVHQPGALTAYLRALWDIRPNWRSYYASWPWRAADDAEVTRLLGVASDASGPDAGFAVRCLLQTRRPEILQEWAARSPLRSRQPSWPVSTGSGQQHRTSGPQCPCRRVRLSG